MTTNSPHVFRKYRRQRDAGAKMPRRADPQKSATMAETGAATVTMRIPTTKSRDRDGCTPTIVLPWYLLGLQPWDSWG